MRGWSEGNKEAERGEWRSEDMMAIQQESQTQDLWSFWTQHGRFIDELVQQHQWIHISDHWLKIATPK